MGMKSNWQKLMDFDQRVGRLTIKEVWDLGFQSKDHLGSFVARELPALVQFCIDNPGFHIVSRVEEYDVNHPVSTANAFWLAEGDKTYDLKVKWDVKIDEEVLQKLRSHKGFAEYNALRASSELLPFEFYFPKRVVN